MGSVFGGVLLVQLHDSLPRIFGRYGGRVTLITDAVIDTESDCTVIAAVAVSAFGIMPEPNDVIETMRGEGGTEIVQARQVLHPGWGAACVTVRH